MLTQLLLFSETRTIQEAPVADLRVEGDELVLHLSRLEKVEGIHGDLRAPLSALRGVEVLENAHAAADVGLKVGTRIFGVVEVGTVYGIRKKRFAAVHHDTPRGVRVTLDGVSYDEWIVGCADPETVVAGLSNPK
jgi:hypothetical protein